MKEKEKVKKQEKREERQTQDVKVCQKLRGKKNISLSISTINICHISLAGAVWATYLAILFHNIWNWDPCFL